MEVGKLGMEVGMVVGRFGMGGRAMFGMEGMFGKDGICVLDIGGILSLGRAAG